MGYFKRVHKLTPTRAWVNNPTQEEAKRAIEAGIYNCTTNPTFAMKQIQREPELMTPILDRICKEEKDDHRAAALIQRESIRPILEIFGTLFDSKNRTSGLVSLQGDPILEDDPQIIIREALEARSLGPNYLAKIPVTKAGLQAMERIIQEDIPLIATEVLSISQAIAVCELYQRVSAQCGKTPPFYVTHITGIFDDHIGNLMKEGLTINPDVAFQAGTAVARKLYNLHQSRGYPGVLLGGGARGLHHFTELVGGNMHITINWKGTAQVLEEDNPAVIERMGTPTPDYVIDELLSIPDFRLAWEEEALSVEEFEAYGPVLLFRKAFEEGWQFLLKEIAKRR